MVCFSYQFILLVGSFSCRPTFSGRCADPEDVYAPGPFLQRLPTAPSSWRSLPGSNQWRSLPGSNHSSDVDGCNFVIGALFLFSFRFVVSLVHIDRRVFGWSMWPATVLFMLKSALYYHISSMLPSSWPGQQNHGRCDWLPLSLWCKLNSS